MKIHFDHILYKIINNKEIFTNIMIYNYIIFLIIQHVLIYKLKFIII